MIYMNVKLTISFSSVMDAYMQCVRVTRLMRTCGVIVVISHSAVKLFVLDGPRILSVGGGNEMETWALALRSYSTVTSCAVLEDEGSHIAGHILAWHWMTSTPSPPIRLCDL